MVQVPATRRLMVLALAAHTAGVSTAKIMGSPDEAVAASVGGCAPRVWFGTAVNVILCGAPSMVIEKSRVALGVIPFVAVNVPAKFPITLGVPLITPVAALSV